MDDARYKHGVIATAIALSLAADAAAQSTPNASMGDDQAQILCRRACPNVHITSSVACDRKGNP